MKDAFRHPKDMKKDDNVPVSTRLPESVRDQLDRAAKRNDLSLSELLANVLKDYAAWLESKK